MEEVCFLNFSERDTTIRRVGDVVDIVIFTFYF